MQKREAPEIQELEIPIQEVPAPIVPAYVEGGGRTDYPGYLTAVNREPSYVNIQE